MRHSVTMPISSHNMFNTVEGSAPCEPLLTMKQAAPTRFIHWNTADWPLNRPAETIK